MYQSIRGLIHTCAKCYMDLCDKCCCHTGLIHDHTCDGTRWKIVSYDFDPDCPPLEQPSDTEMAEEDDDSDTAWSEDSASSSN